MARREAPLVLSSIRNRSTAMTSQLKLQAIAERACQCSLYIEKGTLVATICHALPTGFFQTVTPRECVLFDCGSTL